MQSPVLEHSAVVQAVAGTELLTATQAKLHARIVITAEDDLVTDWIKRARIQVERDTRRNLISHTYDFCYDRFPCERYLRFTGYTPLSSVTHVKYIDADGTLQTWNSSNYEVDEARDSIWLAFNVDWPAIRDIQNAVQIRAVFAHGATDEEVELAKQAILLQLTTWNEKREMTDHETRSYDAIVSRLAKRSYP